MVVVFALVLLAVIVTGVTVILRYPRATEADQGLPPVAPDWTPGSITAHDLDQVRFPVVVRGYRMADVDALMAALAAQLAEVQPAPDLIERGGDPSSGPPSSDVFPWSEEQK